MIERLRLRQVRRAVYDGDHKLVAAENAVEGLFDLARDPAETRDVAADQSDMAAALERKISDFVWRAGKPRDDARAAVMDAKVVEQLRALGYVE
ncbi:MAG: hypothetical protein LC121_00850 [Anaerolineae bacterium]|nr:hypothetical protein [Anaerolineae bacterium]